jgi:hypothetical protein
MIKIKIILIHCFEAISFGCIASILMIYIFGKEASYTLLAKWILAGLLFSLVFVRKKYK